MLRVPVSRPERLILRVKFHLNPVDRLLLNDCFLLDVARRRTAVRLRPPSSSPYATPTITTAASRRNRSCGDEPSGGGWRRAARTRPSWLMAGRTKPARRGAGGDKLAPGGAGRWKMALQHRAPPEREL
jgi:hypothetical protein